METFQNEKFKVEASKSEGCKLDMKVFVSPEEAKKTYKKAVKVVNKQISVPGFRKGKAPNETVISKYGSYVDQEWKDLLIQDAVQGGLNLSNIFPIKKGLDQRPKVGLCSVDEGAEISFSYEYYPSIPEVDFSKISLPKIEKKPHTQANIDEVLLEVQKAHADWEELEKRPAKEGDYVNISIHSVGSEEHPLLENRRVPFEKGHIAPWLFKALGGMKPEESKETMSEGENASKVRITLNSLWKILLPEVNDQLAEKVGASSKDDLLKKVTSNLEKEAEGEQKRKQIEAMEEALLSAYDFDLPGSLCESERETRLRESITELKKKNVSDEEIKAKAAELEKAAQDIAKKSLKLYFLHQQIAKQGDVQVTQKELQDEFMSEMAKNPLYFQQNMEKASSEKLLSAISNGLRDRKVKEYALAQVQLTDK
ncbi:MAG: Trigger factor [Chlamydiales bacterium]|nr:Trigger factor [Chlamydiales bacterium]MCH9619474.1 Trigger factor [Chlamydiales bacterium]MCH9622278.1 Trigger factor [Chlamydiales bacterium]